MSALRSSVGPAPGGSVGRQRRAEPRAGLSVGGILGCPLGHVLIARGCCRLAIRLCASETADEVGSSRGVSAGGIALDEAVDDQAAADVAAPTAVREA